MGARSRRSWTLVILGALLAACGEDPSLPADCTAGQHAVSSALRAAPSPVRMGGTRLSTCVRDASDAADLQTVGAGLVGAASELGDGARRHPGGAAELRLGYLVGAARRGAGDHGGERSELVRRLEQEGQRLRRHGSAYLRGLRAGRRSG